MKKLVLTVTLVALLAAAVFGGQAIASNKPADVTVSEETSAIWGSSYWGYPVRMKTLSGSAEIDKSVETVVAETYPGVRHVSLTIFAKGQTNNDEIFLYINLPSGETYIMEAMRVVDYGFETYEFNTDYWNLEAWDSNEDPIEISYWATITYPSNQW